MPNQTTINCPKCDTSIDINTMIFSQIEELLHHKEVREEQPQARVTIKL